MNTKQQRIGTLAVYNLTGINQSDRNKFCRKFLGWRDKSQHSKYVYNRRGFIDDLPHVRVERAIFIFRKEDVKTVLSFFKEYKIKVFTRDVILEKSDVDILEGDDR